MQDIIQYELINLRNEETKYKKSTKSLFEKNSSVKPVLKKLLVSSPGMEVIVTEQNNDYVGSLLTNISITVKLSSTNKVLKTIVDSICVRNKDVR